VTHYKPGTAIYSIATTGCNWLCKYCQNYDISQRRKIDIMHTLKSSNESYNIAMNGINRTFVITGETCHFVAPLQNL
jgi:pyruvate-formate lyase-activating enzyme